MAGAGPNNNKPSTRRENSLAQCLVCCNGISRQAGQSSSEIRADQGGQNSPALAAEILSDLFLVLCKHMHWRESRKMKRYKFNFETEYFPFCSTCRIDLVRIFKADEQAESILTALTKITLDLSVTIIKTENQNRQHAVDDSGSNLMEELEKKKCYENKIKHYRDITFRRFSPTVGVTKYVPPDKESSFGESQARSNENTIMKSGEILIQSNSSRVDPSQISCLICCEYVELYDYPSKSSSVAKILSNVFYVVRNYMQWDSQRRYHLNFKFEPFPFCKNCRVKLVRIYKLDQQFQPLQKKICDVVKRIHSIMLQSEKKKLFILDSKVFGCSTKELVYNPKKVQFYRRLVLPNFTYNAYRYRGANSGTLNLDVIFDSENEEKSDYVPTSDDEKSSSSRASDPDVKERVEAPVRKRRRITKPSPTGQTTKCSQMNVTDTPKSKTPSSRQIKNCSSLDLTHNRKTPPTKQKNNCSPMGLLYNPTTMLSTLAQKCGFNPLAKQKQFLAALMGLGKAIHQTEYNKFTLDGQIEFEHRAHGTWWCTSCNLSMGNKLEASAMLWHVRLHEVRSFTTSSAANVNENRYLVKQISPTRFQYGMYYFDKEYAYTLICTRCHASVSTRHSAIASVQANHVCHTVVYAAADTTNRSQHNDFVVRATRSLYLYCSYHGCTYCCDSRNYSPMCVHILHCHENNDIFAKTFQPEAFIPEAASHPVGVDSYVNDEQWLNLNQMSMEAPDPEATPTDNFNNEIEDYFNLDKAQGQTLDLDYLYPELTITANAEENYIEPQVESPMY